jgi:hypothetical protein
MTELQQIYNILQAGGPVAVAALLFYMWREERKEVHRLQKNNDQLQEKTMENAVAQIQATTKMESAIIALKDLLSQFINKMS